MSDSVEDAPLDPNILIGTCISNRFELEELIAQGPASFVYRASDEQSGGSVAVKLLLDDRAYADVSAVDHTDIVQPLARGSTEAQVPYVVTELCSGRSLARLLEEAPPNGDESIRIVIAVARALGAAHAKGLAHGSLKPSDVCWDGERARILDLGAAPRSVARPSRTISARIRAMAVVFGAGSAAPDDLPAEPLPAPVPRDDVYALGALLRTLLSTQAAGGQGKEPTVGVRVEPHMQAVLRVMLRALSKDPESRHADASELADDLEHAQSEAKTLADRPEAERTVPTCIDAGSLIGRTLGQRYRIERVIGRGSTAIVFQARHLELESKVALKVLAPVGIDEDGDDFGDRFRFEAQVLADLRHENVINVFDLGTTGDGLRYIAMELLEGETLAAMLKSRPRLPPKLAVHIARQTANALAALHERGLVHRDVKPANIFISGIGPRPRVKLMDFGLARAVDSLSLRDTSGSPESSAEGPRRRQKTLEGIILGTAAYMSPELIQAKTLDARSDIYALAVVTYRMLTGHMPFVAEDVAHLLARHVCEPATSMRARVADLEISDELDRAVLRGLEKNRDQRPATARIFAEELSAGLEAPQPIEVEDLDEPSSEVGLAAPPLPRAPQRRLRSRGRMGVALGVLLGVVLVIAAFGSRDAPAPVAAPRHTATAVVAAPLRTAEPAPPARTAEPEPETTPAASSAPIVKKRPARRTRPTPAAPKMDDLKRPNFSR